MRNTTAPDRESPAPAARRALGTLDGAGAASVAAAQIHDACCIEVARNSPRHGSAGHVEGEHT